MARALVDAEIFAHRLVSYSPDDAINDVMMEVGGLNDSQ
jgi:hypothetical protein